MKSKYRVGNTFSSIAPDILIITDVLIPKDGRQPIYGLSHIISCGYYVCKLYGYYNEEELNTLNYIEI
jgi:hypothetical protein